MKIKEKNSFLLVCDKCKKEKRVLTTEEDISTFKYGYYSPIKNSPYIYCKDCIDGFLFSSCITR